MKLSTFRYFILCCFIITCLYASFFSLSLYGLTNIYVRLSILKDFFFIILFLSSIQLFKIKNNLVEILMLMFSISFVFLLITTFIWSTSELNFKILNARYIVLIVLYFYVLFEIFKNLSERQFFLFHLFLHYNIIFLTIFCFLESIFRNYIWSTLDLYNFWAINNLFGESSNESFELSGRMLSYDLVFLIGEPVSRLIGPILDPAVLSLLCVTYLFFISSSVFYTRKAKKLYLIFVLVIIVFTFSKNVIALIFLLPIIYVYQRFCIRYTFFLPFIMLAISILISVFFVNTGLIDGPFAHSTGLYTGFFGSELISIDRFALAGNLSSDEARLTADSILSYPYLFRKFDGSMIGLGTESAFGSLLSQLGLIPSLLWLTFLSLILHRLRSNFYSVALLSLWFFSMINNMAAFNTTTLPILVAISMFIYHSSMSKKAE